jgi:hypothetical protein
MVCGKAVKSGNAGFGVYADQKLQKQDVKGLYMGQFLSKKKSMLLRLLST